MPDHLEERKDKKLHPLLCFGILIMIVLVVNALIDLFVIKIVMLSIAGLLLSNVWKIWNLKFVLELGGILILMVMAVLGLKLKFNLIQMDVGLLVFLITWLISHFFIMLAMAKLLNANTAWVPIASMANVGGIATAPAVTAAYKKEWMPHAIILAILSMATGTFWGLLTIYLLEYVLNK
jgi:uncharacterized membrane protein